MATGTINQENNFLYNPSIWYFRTGFYNEDPLFCLLQYIPLQKRLIILSGGFKPSNAIAADTEVAVIGINGGTAVKSFYGQCSVPNARIYTKVDDDKIYFRSSTAISQYALVSFTIQFIA